MGVERFVPPEMSGHKASPKEGMDMDVRLNRLINSAEKIVQDKKGKEEGTLPKQTVSSSLESTDFIVSLPVQYHNIQTRLTELQKQLSREQARIGVLQESGEKDTPLLEILFEGEPLFPELVSAPDTSPSSLLEKSQGTLQTLTSEIRKKEVEGENIFSLGMMLSPEEFRGKLGAVSTQALKPISESIVQKLLGN